jgi:hypothetical protein
MYTTKPSLLTYFWSLKVCHPRCICIVRNNKDTIRQNAILCYRESKIATRFGCTKLPSSGRLFQKLKRKLYKTFSLSLSLSLYIYTHTHIYIHIYVYIYIYITFMKHTASRLLPCTAEICSYFRFSVIKIYVLMDCILIVSYYILNTEQ